MIRMRPSKFFLSFSLALAICACSVADLEKPVTDFASATDNAAKALDQLNTEVTSAYAELVKKRALAGQGLVVAPTGDCLVSSDRCRLQLQARDTSVQALTPDPALRKMIALMSAIRTYAEGLEAIVKADTAAKVETSVNATVGSLVKLATTAQKAGGADKTASIDVSQYATPVGELMNWVFGQYIARVKLDGLKRATRNAKDVVSAAAGVFGDATSAAAAVPKAAMAAAVSKRVDAFDDNRTEANFNKLVESAAAFDQMLVAKPANVFAGLVTAHNALADKLQDEKLSLAVVTARIQSFAEEAQKLSKILNALADARKKQGD